MSSRSIAGLFVLFCSIALTNVANPFASNPRDEMKRSTPVSVGEQAPDFTLEDIRGNQVTLSATRGKVPTVLVFYRGYWCPFCAHQLSELRSLLKADEQVRLLAVSVDDHQKTKQLIEKIAADGNGAVNYTMLSDPGHKVIDAYGLHDPTYDGTKFDGIPHPTVYVIDKNGRVAWAKVETDYKVRPSNADIRAALEALNQDHVIMKRQIFSLSSSLTIVLSLGFAWTSRAVHAQATPPKISTKLSLTTENVQRGRSVRASLVIDIPAGYHINAHDPVSRFALPTKIEVEAPDPIRISSILYPKAIVRRFTFSEDRLGVYENRAVIRFNVVIPPNQQTGKSEIKTRLSYQSCSDEVCFPPQKREINVVLNVL